MSSSQLIKNIRYALRFLPDKAYIQANYFLHTGKKLDLEEPTTFNEKLNWLKLYDHDPKYTDMVDKYAVKKIVGDMIGEEYIIPTLGVWEHFDEIDFDSLPDQFVLKCTHDSEGLVIVKDKASMDMDAAREKLENALKHNFYYIGREWPYKNVPPRIIAEPYLEDHIDGQLKDYKFFCFDGEVKAMFIASDRTAGETKFDFYDLDFNHLDITQKYPHAKENRKPSGWDKMIELAGIISKGVPHVRVDFYEVDGKVYFGEYTLYHFSGFVPFEPPVWDKTFGDWLKLPDRRQS